MHNMGLQRQVGQHLFMQPYLNQSYINRTAVSNAVNTSTTFTEQRNWRCGEASSNAYKNIEVK